MRRLLLLGLAATVAFADEAVPSPARALRSIHRDELAQHVEYLASDALEGRDSGSPGGTAASAYIAKHFAAHGLQPVGDGDSYFQAFDIGTSAGAGPDNRLAVRLPGQDALEELAIERDYTPYPFSAWARATGELVFAGYGITAEAEKYDDYAGIDVKGKIVLILRHEPRADQDGPAFNGKRHTRHAYYNTKVALAQQRGAAALIIVSSPTVLEPGDPLFGSRGDRDPHVKIPVVHLKLAQAERWLAAAALDLRAVQAQMDRDLAPASRATGIHVELMTQIVEEKLAARNVLGLLPGEDPALQDEIVVIGAHYDHVGRGYFGSSRNARGQIHNGADDNASGTAGLLELVQAYATPGLPRRRSVLFIAFAGEERGLLGSIHYVEHPVRPLAQHVAMINLDMIGRNATAQFEVNGVGTSPIWRPLVERISGALGVKARYGESGYAPSDNTSFYQKKIPVLFLFTGLHADYHAPTDDPERINREQMEVVSRYAFCVTHYLTAVLDKRPEVIMAEPRGRRGPYLGVQLGAASEGPGVDVNGVEPNSPAQKAGLLAGDVICAVDGAAIADLQALSRELAKHKPGDTVALTVRRGDQEHTLKVVLGGRP